MEHTKGPWEAVTRDHKAIVRTVAEAHKVAEARSREPLQVDEANAAFIVKAVNNHEKLMDFIRFDLIARLTPATDPKGVADKHWRKLQAEIDGIDPDYENAEAQREA